MTHIADSAGLAALNEHGSYRKAAASLGVPASTLQNMVARARAADPEAQPFHVDPLPRSTANAEDILARRKVDFDRKQAAHQGRKLIPVKVKLDGPIGVAHFGDPHLDDDGTNLALIERHTEICQRTEGIFAANVGDTTNNWIGRLARLYGEQGTTAAEAWVLAEWFVQRLRWLYMIAGNHDCWSGAGDPLKWIAHGHAALYEPHGARLNLVFPNGREIRINARHDFPGNSMWNTVHGAAKAAQMGWRDHILTCGHKHTSGYMPVKCPASGLVSHCIRVASYKTFDRYAEEKGLPDQNFTENVLTVIDPAADDRGLVTVFLNLEEGAEYLTWKREKFTGRKSRCFIRAPSVS
jgi:hypothetical protein